MELNFERSAISCLDVALQEILNTELTQQIKLPDGMPDIGRIIASWGQVILRGKEWLDGEITANGGMMVWVLYAPEDGGKEVCIDTWIPFQMKWDLPEEVPDGTIRIRCLTRFVDARSVSPRKIMVRSGVAAQVEAYIPAEREAAVPTDAAADVELLQTAYPLRIPKEAGEKVFMMDEDLTLPDSAPQPEKLIYSRMNPKIQDRRVLADKLVFRGSGNLHLLYRGEDGLLYSWDLELPFSQFAELEQEYGNEAQGDVALAVTNLEAELDDEGHLRLKGGVAAQYMITDREMVSLVEDAYSPGRELTVHTEVLEMPVVLESRRENIYGEQTIAAEASRMADAVFLPDFPRQRRSENGVDMEIPGAFQMLYYDNEGRLQSSSARWEGRQHLETHEKSFLTAVPVPVEPQTVLGSGQIMAKAEVPLDMVSTTRQQIPMVTGVEMGVQRIPDPNRPALILRRAGESRLWDIAKGSGSTVEDIRRANSLQGEPVPGQMLLIPVR